MMTLANKLTLMRFALTPIIVVLILLDSQLTGWLALILFIATALLDFFDGYFARKRDERSVFGRVLDPIADKFLVISCLISLMIAGEVESIVSALMVLILIAREVFISGLREQLAELKISVPVSKSGKAKTVLQFIAIAVLMIPVPVEELLMHASLLVATLFSLMSAYQYVRVFAKHAKVME